MNARKPNRAARGPWPFSATVGAALVLAGVVLGVTLVFTGPLPTGEYAVSEFVLSKPNMTLVWLGTWVSQIFGMVWGVALLAGLAAITAYFNRRTALWLVIMPFAAWFPCMVLKYVFQRPRPAYVGLPTFVTDFATDSFPSGHTGFAIGLVAAIVVVMIRAGRNPWPAFVIGGPIVVLVAVSVVVVGRHWFGDTLGSMLIAPGAVMLLYPWLPRWIPWLDDQGHSASPTGSRFVT